MASRTTRLVSSHFQQRLSATARSSMSRAGPWLLHGVVWMARGGRTSESRSSSLENRRQLVEVVRARPHAGRSCARFCSICTRSESTADSVLISRIVSSAESDGDIARLRRIASSSCIFTRSNGWSGCVASIPRPSRDEHSFVNPRHGGPSSPE